MQYENLKLQDQLLIAMPGMTDTRFDHSVTLIARHDTSGSFGLVINNPTQTTIGDLFTHLKIESTDETLNKMPVREGGPVQLGQGFVLHDGAKDWENTIRIKNSLAITASKDILADIAINKGPENFLVMLGCASWTAGQIEAELLDNAWLTCPSQHQLLFDTSPTQCWMNASQTLGVDMSFMSTTAGHA